MQFVISMKELKEALAGLAKVVNTRKSVPVLAAVKITAGDGKATMTGTNLTEFLSYGFENASGEGSFLIDLSLPVFLILSFFELISWLFRELFFC